MKKILSALISATVILNVVPLVSSAEETIEIPPLVPPYTVDGDSVIFQGGKDYDFIVSSCSKFTSERNDNSFKFTPSYNSTSFLISRVHIAEEIINYDVVYDIEVDGTFIESHCHYFYPVIENYAVTYNINTGTQIVYNGCCGIHSSTEPPYYRAY